MLIEKAIFDNLCPSYQNVIQELEEKYNVISENDYAEKIDLFKDYFHHYLVLPGIWDIYLTFLDEYKWISKTDEEFNQLLTTTLNERYYGSRISPYHFNKDNTIHAMPIKLLSKKPRYSFGNPYQGPFTIKEIEPEVILPRNGMDKTWRFYEEYSRDPIPKNIFEKYQISQKFYKDIEKHENDQIKWFNLLIQCDNEEYVCDNIDARLGKNLNNIELWNLYFKYLKQQNTKRLLHLYSRYCRYFLDDSQMKEEYKELVKKYGPIKVFWKNAFDFEFYEKDINLVISETGHIIFNDIEEKTPSHSKPTNIATFNTKPSFDCYKIQTFSLPKTIMAYILENRSPQILLKLHKSCKYFFILQPFPVCHRFLRICKSDDIRFTGHVLQIPYDYYDDKNGIFNNNIILSNSYMVTKELFLSKIHQCNLKYIRMWSIYTNILWNELVFLFENRNVEVLDLSDVKIINEDGTPVPLEEILKLVPKIIEFTIRTPQLCTTPQTFMALPKLKFTNKIQLFDLSYFSYFEPYRYSEFLKKNIDSNSEVLANFEPKMDPTTAYSLKKEVEKELHGFWPDAEKPSIRVHGPIIL